MPEKITKEEKAFLEYWFEKNNPLYFRQNNGTKTFNGKKDINFKVISDDKSVCLSANALFGRNNIPSKGERYALEDLSVEFEIIEKLNERWTYEIMVDNEVLKLECDVYRIKKTR